MTEAGRAADVLSLAGRVAVVTGAASSVGTATAVALARAGARVAVLDPDEAALGRAASTIAADGGAVVPYTVDSGDAVEVEMTIAAVVERWGRLDVLVNNAGGVRHAWLEEVSETDLQQLDHRLRSVVVCTRAVVPQMKARRSGRILSGSSSFARVGTPGLSADGAANAGVIGLTRAWARELGPFGITANCVAPGLIESDAPGPLPPEDVESALDRIPAHRPGTAAEVANVYLFLASDLASFMNGAVVGVDGGLLLY